MSSGPSGSCLTLGRLVGLAPLSKAERLKHLDLSNDFYDIGLYQLLQAICDHTHLAYLSAPKGALKGAYGSTGQRYRWPSNLNHLRLNGTMPNAINEWEGLFTDLPTSLLTLTFSFLNIPGRNVPDVFWYMTSSAKQVTSLHILHARYASLRAVALFKPFPNLKLISLPYDRAGLEEICSLHGGGVLSHTLETLALTDDSYVCTADLNPVGDALGFGDLGLVVSQFPSLKRLEVPSRYYSDLGWEGDVADIDVLQRRFYERWPSEPQSDVGVFLGDSKVEDMPSWIKNTWGARSVSKVITGNEVVA